MRGPLTRLLRPIAVDLRYAARGLRRSPWYAATVIGVMALGMALTTTVFAVVDGVLFKPLPYPRASELLSVEAGWASRPQVASNLSVSPSDLLAWARAVPNARFAAFSLGGLDYIDSGDAASYSLVSEAFFDVLGQQPLFGGFSPSDFRGQHPVRPIVLTYGSWQRRFGGDSSVIGRVIRSDGGQSWAVKGILPRDFLFPHSGRLVPEFVTPYIFGPNAERDRRRYLIVFARVPPAIPIAEVASRVQQATLDLAARFPGEPDKRWTMPFDVVRLRPIDTTLRSESRSTFALVFGAAALLVGMGCLNVTGLAAARVHDRQREFALRRALGAANVDLIRLMGAESAIVAVAGALLGLGGALALIPAVGMVLPEGTVLFRALQIDQRVLAFAALASMLCAGTTTTWLASVAIGASRQPALAEAARITARSRLHYGLLTGVQVALALMMSVCGALVAGSLVRIWHEDPGYHVDSTYTIALGSRIGGDGLVSARLVADLESTPGVLSAGGSNYWVLQRAIRGSIFETPAGATPTGDVESMGVTGGFFETMGLRPTAGRWPTRAEFAAGARVVVVSQRAASEVLARCLGGRTNAEAKGTGLLRSSGSSPMRGMCRSIGTPKATSTTRSRLTTSRRSSACSCGWNPKRPEAMSSVLSLMAARYPTYRVSSARSLADSLGRSIQGRRFRAVLFSTFGLAGIFIAGVGVLALVAVTTGRRTREVGIRLALGAQPREIAGLVVRQELVAVCAGMAVGLVASVWIVRLTQSYMYKMSVYDPAVWAVAVAFLLAVAILGALIPAVRASRVDPVQALRAD